MSPTLIQSDDTRILVVSDIRGQLSLFNKLAKQYKASMIIHTGNFGFLDKESIDRIHESYLRHIVEFSPLLPQKLILEISKLSKVTGHSVEHLSNEHESLKKLLKNHSISELDDFLSGKKHLDVPVYTIYGMCEDSLVINKFRYGVYSIPNLTVVDDCHVIPVTLSNGQSLILAGIGGSLSYHKLFHQGSAIDLKEIMDTSSPKQVPESVIPVSGDPGNIWITVLQFGRLIKELIDFSLQNPDLYAKSIKIFLTHQSPTREPLLEHLAIFFKMDYTISDSLHFKYSSSYNELSINPSFESFKAKFNDCRYKFASIWKNVQPRFESLLYRLDDQNMIDCIELALEVFDKIPISSKGNDEIISLQLSKRLSRKDDESGSNYQVKQRELNAIIRQLNDLYYIFFQNTWHINLCDIGYGHAVLYMEEGQLSMEMKSRGFDFSYRLQDGEDANTNNIANANTTTNGNTNTNANTKHRQQTYVRTSGPRGGHRARGNRRGRGSYKREN